MVSNFGTTAIDFDDVSIVYIEKRIIVWKAKTGAQ